MKSNLLNGVAEVRHSAHYAQLIRSLCINELGEALALDGAIGPATLAAAAKYDPAWLAQKYLWRRLKYYANDVALNLRREYLSGWVNRCIKIKNDLNPRPGSITREPLLQEKISCGPILAKVKLMRDAVEEIADVLENYK